MGVFCVKVCLCALSSDTSSVRADHLPTSHPHPAVTSAQFPAATEGLYKQKTTECQSLDLNVLE